MTKIERELKRRERRRLADLNRNDRTIWRGMLSITLAALAIMIGAIVWWWAASMQAMEAEAAVLEAHWGPGAEIVGPIPEEIPEELPPTAINETAVATMPDAEKVERVGEEHVEWESIGVWKLTAYCPLECCNGKGRAWKTSSGKPMKVGWTVASYSLPEGTQVMINGHVYCVEDTGVNHIDILYPDHQSASDFGIRKAEVFIKR